MLHSLYVSNTANVLLYYAPNFEKVGSILLSACPFVCPFVLLSVRSKKFRARVSKFHIWTPHQKITYPYFFLSELSPLDELCPLEGLIVQICNHDILKTITARSFKLGQLIEDNQLGALNLVS